jgi:hypothetical protein
MKALFQKYMHWSIIMINQDFCGIKLDTSLMLLYDADQFAGIQLSCSLLSCEDCLLFLLVAGCWIFATWSP